MVGFASLGPDLTTRRSESCTRSTCFRNGGVSERAGRSWARCSNTCGPRGSRRAVLWVLADNPRARCFYERSGWFLDGEEREETLLDTPVSEVRYRIGLGDVSQGLSKAL